jgi:hypothetical protein
MTLRRAARLVTLTVLLGLARGATAGEEPERADALTVRLFDVSALTAGTVQFLPEPMGVLLRTGGDDVGRNTEGERPVQPLGTIEEMVELLKNEVAPESWTTNDGADAKCMGSRTLVVRQRPAVHAAIGAAIRGWEERVLRTITVEVQALRHASEGAPTAHDAVAARVERATGDPGGSLTALPGQGVALFTGTRRAFVASYDLSAGKQVCSDPLVGIANLGLSVHVQALPSALPDRVHLWISARLTEVGTWETSRVGPGGPIAVPSMREVAVRQRLEVRAGRWTLLDGASEVGGVAGWSFAVRARLDPRVAAPATAGLVLPALGPGDLGGPVARHFDSSLFEPGRTPRHQGLEEAVWTGAPWIADDRELVCPCETVAPDALVDLVKETLDADRWLEGSEVLLRNRGVVLRAPAKVVAAVGKTIGTLERGLLTSVTLEAQVLDVRADLALTPDTVLSAEGAEALAAALAAGEARRIDDLRLTCDGGANNAIASGESLTYVQDLDPLSQEVPEPVAERRPLRDGAVLDANAVPTSTMDAAYVTVRFLRTWVQRPLAVAETSLGEIQVPEVRTLRIRTGLVIPFDATAVVGSAVENGRRTVLLITPRLRRAGD